MERQLQWAYVLFSRPRYAKAYFAQHDVWGGVFRWQSLTRGGSSILWKSIVVNCLPVRGASMRVSAKPPGAPMSEARCYGDWKTTNGRKLRVRVRVTLHWRGHVRQLRAQTDTNTDCHSPFATCRLPVARRLAEPTSTCEAPPRVGMKYSRH